MACAHRMLSPDVASVEPCAIHSCAILGNMLCLKFLGSTKLKLVQRLSINIAVWELIQCNGKATSRS